MKQKQLLSFFAGFLLLFIIYHVPEFFPGLWIAAVCKTGLIVLASAIGYWQGKKGLTGYGLALRGHWISHLLTGLVCGLLVFCLYAGASHLLGYEPVLAFKPVDLLLKQLPMLMLMTAVPSVAEDLLTRGYLYAHLRNTLKGNQWILLSALVFTGNHIWRLNEGAAVLTYIFLMGVALAYTLWKTRSLWLAFGIHWGSNLAYESSRVLLDSKSVSAEAGHWIFAGCWLFTCIMLFAIMGKGDKP